MRYITGIHALNLPCQLNTCGDWHQSALKWKDVTVKESESTMFGDYGIEAGHKIPEHNGEYFVANHIRALLDLVVEDENFAVAQGMRENFVCNEEYTPEIFAKLWGLRGEGIDAEKWERIDEFMLSEYKLAWWEFTEAQGYQRRSMREGTEAMGDWRHVHELETRSFLGFLNQQGAGYVLKGGTALMLCYGLDRFSEDIDLDGLPSMRNIIDIVAQWASINGFGYNVNKDTSSVKRVMVHYGGNLVKPLKIETSYRLRNIDKNDLTVIYGMLTYNIEALLEYKCEAYSASGSARDLYDLCFILIRYGSQISEHGLKMAARALSYKGFGQFGYLAHTQRDELVNMDVLADRFMQTWNRLGLTI